MPTSFRLANTCSSMKFAGLGRFSTGAPSGTVALKTATRPWKRTITETLPVISCTCTRPWGETSAMAKSFDSKSAREVTSRTDPSA